MHTLPESVRALFSRLFQLWSKRKSLSHSEKLEEAEILQKIREFTEPAAIPLLFGLLCSEREPAGAIAAETIQQIVEKCDISTLIQLDAKVRTLSDWRFPPLTDSKIIRLSRGLNGPLGLLSFHGNGYTREGAIHALSSEQSGQELPFLLIRLNDWVSEVRDAAKKAVVARIRTEYVVHFIQCLPLIYRLQKQSRKDHRPLVDSIINLICSEEAHPVLQEAVLQGGRQTRRLALRLLVDHPSSDLLPFLEELLESRDPVIRLSAARELRTRLAGDSLLAVLERLIHDRLMPVRREALYGYANKFPELAQQYLREALLDSYKSIRETARFYLSKSGPIDFRAFYLSNLDAADEFKRAAATSSLGEVGKPEDAPRLSLLFQDASARVRRSAVRAVGRLNPEIFADQILEMLEDTKPVVAKAAREVFSARPDLLKPQQLWRMFERAQQHRTRHVIISLIRLLQWWDSAALLVSATGCGDSDAVKLAISYLEQWRGNNRRMTNKPTNQQLHVLRDAVQHNRHQLPENIANDLEAHIMLATRARS